MAVRKAVVVGANGQLQQLQSGDQLSAPIANESVYLATNGEAGSITQGMAVYISASGTVKKAKADAAGTSKAFGLVSDASISAAASGQIIFEGILSMADWTSIIGTTSLTFDTYYFLSPNTAGLLTATPPTTVGQLNVIVGHALSATEMEIFPTIPILL